ncbi:phosphoribosyltransferase family protein [uncultured Clostridium sp.]|uniref:ComF family protein n=1 Tax=uncultured Clostridium sp. TaxID=59620 RepID=UPI0026044823|nr:phosphoribosyltransferase family protein [uncultured Clostridium sp.]
MGREIFNVLDMIFQGFLEIIFPKKNECLICKEEAEGICNKCSKKIVKCEKSDISYAYYNEELKELILLFKFRKNFNAGEVLASFLIEKLKDEKEEYILTFVPISKRKMKKRGFNQCEYLCKKAGKVLKIDVIETLIQVKDVREQKTLSKQERSNNVKGIFKIINKEKIKNKKLILVDDVITTGATLKECEKILKNGGIGSIKLLTIGKSDI